MSRTVVFTGILSTCESQSDSNGKASYKVHLGGVPLVPYIADQFPYGGYVTITLRDVKGVSFTCGGNLSVCVAKQFDEYYKNGWRQSRERTKMMRKVFLGGIPLTTRIATLFKHAFKRFHYERGVFDIIVKESD